MRNLLTASAALALAALAACSGGKKVVQAPLPAAETESRQLDTMVISADAEPQAPEDYEFPVYRASQSRTADLVHTELHVAFDWPKEQVIGQATLTLVPLFRPITEVTLDAKHFAFGKVALGDAGGQELEYAYDSVEVVVTLPREYARGDTFALYLDYVATPQVVTGGSSAISSDKGLFFIDPRDEDPEKPSQIWTQGETEHNSNWMPTIDQPNERATQDFHITVADKYQTLSNGVLVSSEPAADGKRTDRWRMDLPHAPYLHMIAVGEFAKVDDTWEGIPLSYYVESDYAPYAKEIFAHTPEMLTFFSELTGVKYPWPKYSQIIVRDYVSGAMENTSAVIFGEFVQKNDRELADDNNDLIVAHEMFHHWFGDYVTTESWSNLTLNEGFANYSEYLWFEEHDGVEAAEDHRLNELEGYVGSGNFHPLIWYQWDSNEDMFDAHSYNKGGLVLHMLRNYLGDDAFFAGLKKYLEDNALSAVEVDELRIAMEDTVGEDLQWFFDQWFLGNGHPELTISYGLADGQATVTVEQTQDPEAFRPIFKLPTQVGVYPANGGAPRMEDVVVDQRLQTFTFDVQDGDLVVFDPKSVILGVVEEERGVDDQLAIFERVPEQRKALFAIRAINAAQDSVEVPQAIVDKAVAAKSLRIRNNGLALVDADTPEGVAQLRKAAREDDVANVRSTALLRLVEEVEDPELAALYAQVLDEDQSYLVMSTGLQGLLKVNPQAALDKAKELEEIDSDELSAGIATLYAGTGDAGYLSFFERKIETVDGQSAGSMAGAYLGLALQAGGDTLTSAITTLGELAVDQATSPWRRFGFTSALAELRGAIADDQLPPTLDVEGVAPLISEQIEAVKAAETNAQLQQVFATM